MHKFIACVLALITFLGSVPTVVPARDVMTVSEYVQALLIAEGNAAEPNRVSVPIDNLISQQRMTELFPSRFGGSNARAGIVPTSGGLTGTVLVSNVDLIESFDNTWQNSVSFNAPGGVTRAIDSRRYRADINGVWYEAFCADPHLFGPNVAPVPYTIRHAGSDLLTVLRYGFPHNPAWTDSSEAFFLSEPYATYITRVAVAAANWLGQGGNLDGDSDIIISAMQLINGENWVNTYYARGYLRIAVNGQESASAESSASGGMIVSDVFNLTHPYNDSPVMFRWPAGTPNGAVLLDSGGGEITVGQQFTGDRSFRIAVPEGTNANEVTVEIVGINNDYAGHVWTSRIQNDNAAFQDIVFYIPEVFASAVMTPTTTPGTTPTPTPPPIITPEPLSNAVRIQKVDALTRENIPGALVRLRGMSSHQVVTGDGNAADGDPSNHIWEIDNTGINLSQVLTAGATTAVPGDVTSTVEDGVWTITGLPWGFFMAEEERAPDGYSLLPQHTAFGFWNLPPNVIVQGEGNAITCPVTGQVLEVIVEYEIIEIGGANSILITFENYPFGEIEVLKFDEITGAPLAGAHIRLQGFFPEGNPGGMPIDRTEITGADGRILFEDLPAGQYTISEVFAPPGYILDNDFVSVSITWGQSTTVHLLKMADVGKSLFPSIVLKNFLLMLDRIAVPRQLVLPTKPRI